MYYHKIYFENDEKDLDCFKKSNLDLYFKHFNFILKIIKNKSNV